MGASIVVYWPGITEEQIDLQPGFYNDDRAWGNWMAEREEDTAVEDAVKRLNADAILTYKTDGVDDDDVSWVSPEQLRQAAARLREAVKAGVPDARMILESYELGANSTGDPVEEMFIRDLDDIIAMADWAEKQGATQMTLEVNW